MTPDLRHMDHALRLARRGLGNVWPNPAVGCVIVADGRIAGRGWTQPGGRPHAERMALAMAQPTACGYWVPRLPEMVKKPKSLAEYMIGSWRPLIGSAALE